MLISKGEILSVTAITLWLFMAIPSIRTSFLHQGATNASDVAVKECCPGNVACPKAVEK